MNDQKHLDANIIIFWLKCQGVSRLPLSQKKLGRSSTQSWRKWSHKSLPHPLIPRVNRWRNSFPISTIKNIMSTRASAFSKILQISPATMQCSIPSAFWKCSKAERWTMISNPEHLSGDSKPKSKISFSKWKLNWESPMSGLGEKKTFCTEISKGPTI